MIKWTGGATLVSNGVNAMLYPGFIDLQKKSEDSYLLSFVSDINNRFIVTLSKKECEDISEKLKDILKGD